MGISNSNNARILKYYETLIEQEKTNWYSLDRIEDSQKRLPTGANVESGILAERAELERRGEYIMHQLTRYLDPQIRLVGLKGIDWICSDGTINGDGAWGRTAGKDSRVLNTLEVCMALAAWQQLLSEEAASSIAIHAMAARLPSAVQWVVKQQSSTGAFVGLTHDLPAVHNTAIAIWLVCTSPFIRQLDTQVDWDSVVANAVTWLSQTRVHLRGHRFFKGYRFFGEDESSASRIFASIWALRALTALVTSPFASISGQWDLSTVGSEISSFLEAARMDTHHRLEWQYLMGHKVTENRPSAAIVAMLLTLLAEARKAALPIRSQAELVITPAIDYLFTSLGEQEPNVWDEETEAYEQVIPKERKTTMRAWQHIATPWCLQALVLHQQGLDLQRRLILVRSIIAVLEQQADEGYFRLIQGGEADRSNSVFATALNLYALSNVASYLEHPTELSVSPPR